MSFSEIWESGGVCRIFHSLCYAAKSGNVRVEGYTTGIGEIILKLRIPNKMRVLILNATKRARVQHQRELLLGNLRLSINAQAIDICFCVHRLSVDCWRHGFAHSAK